MRLSLDSGLSDHSAVAQMMIDPVQDRIVRANQAACRLLAQDVLQLQQCRVSQVFCQALPQLIVFTQEVLARGEGWSDALNLLLPQQEQPSRVEVTAKSFILNATTYLHLSIQVCDQLDRWRSASDAHRHYQHGLGHWQRVSRVFQEFERENQLILDAAGEGIYGVDAEGMTTFVNPAAERILGYQAAELAGRNIHYTIHHSHSDGSHFGVETCPIFKAFRDGLVHRVEDDVFWSKEGRPIDVEYTSTPIRDNGFIVGAVVIFRDVSQKKADRKRLLEALAEVEQLKDRLELENAYLQEELNSEFNHHQIIGHSPAVQKIIQQTSLVAPTDASVLIYGESGTGKELIARAIHEMSQRSGRALIRVNCAAIPSELFESEFFGHAKGAFTGATRDRPGRFELADGGTLFLDEVGEIPLQLQGKLLRVLQEQQFERVGDDQTRHVDVRIIAATNRDLKQQVVEGKFREDLYFRLNVFPIESVPLRERLDDIPLLTQHFLARASALANKPGLKVPMSELDKLQRYHWPGNIRELENVIERHVILAQGKTLRFDGLHIEPQVPSAPLPRVEPLLTQGEVKQQQRQRIITALQRSQGKVSGVGGAAELLALKPTTLASQIKKYAINPRDYRPN